MSQNDTLCNKSRRLLSEMPARDANTHVVATLAWADAIERLDILVMEIRHIQSNIAQLLRKPRLLNLLRYEEIFIWGTVGDDDERARAKNGQALPDWIDLFGMLDNVPDCLAQLSSFFVLPIDSRSKRREGAGFEDVFMLERYRKQRLQLIEDVSSDVAASLYSSGLGERPHWAQWGQEHRRNYHLFRALQRIKRNLVLAKLQLCWWGAWAYRLIGNNGTPSIDKKRLAHFMAVRAGVMDKLGNAVARLGDLQSQFERALDLGPQEITRPLGGRRRHGALTAAFLHNRSHELWAEMHELLGFLDVDNPTSDAIKPITVHRWNHDSQWSSHVIFDETTERRNVDENASPAIDFLISSYWAPDRPDLQAMLAHDAAAAALRQRLPLADRMQLAAGSGPLVDLLQVLNYEIMNYQPDQRSLFRKDLTNSGQSDSSDPPIRGEEGLSTRDDGLAGDSGDLESVFDLDASFSRAKRSLMPILAADLLAASIYGSAYLFALFQNTLGRGLEQLFKLPGGQVDLGIAREAWNLGHLNDEAPLDWYLRIKIVCAWLKVVKFEDERSALGGTLLGGVEGLSDDILNYICDLYLGEARRWPKLWDDLTRQLCAVVSVSPAADRVAKWRSERLKPYEDLPEGVAAPIRRAKRSSRPMPPDLAGFLRSVLITQKREKPGRGLNREMKQRGDEASPFDEITSVFDHLYLRDGKDETGSECAMDHRIKSLRFFRNLHDIPWEAAVMRGVDFLDNLRHQRQSQSQSQSQSQRWRGFGPISTMSLDFQPGRETFQVALEFQLLLTKRPADRLFNSLNLVNGILGTFERPFEDQNLKTWFHSSVPESERSPQTPSRPSPKRRLDHWIDPASVDGGRHALPVDEINKLSQDHDEGLLEDKDVREACAELAQRTGVESLLRLSAAVQVSPVEEDVWQRVDPSAEYILDRIHHAKLEQLAKTFDRATLHAANIKLRQGDDTEIVPAKGATSDWKTISSLIALHMYLELNSSDKPEEDDDRNLYKEKRRRSRKMILDALNDHRGSRDDDWQSINVREISYLSISDALDHRDKPAEEDQTASVKAEPSEVGTGEQQHRFRQLYDPPQAEVHPLAAEPDCAEAGFEWPTATFAACLGRFDRVLLSDSSPLLTHRLPRFPRTDDGDPKSDGHAGPAVLHYHWDVPSCPDTGDIETFSAFVQKRETALKLSLKGPDPSGQKLVPLALVSIGLTQRYSRLEFVARLLQTMRSKPKIGAYALEGAYQLIEPGDQAFLTDGAYDLTVVMMGQAGLGHEERLDRLKDVMRLSITLHGDFMVDRTETHFLAPMIDCVLADESHSVTIVQEVRLKESSTQQYAYRFLQEEFTRFIEEENGKIKRANPSLGLPKDFETRAIEDIQPRMRIVPGRADVAISYESAWLKLHCERLKSEEPEKEAGLLDKLMSIVLKDWYVDRIATTIGVDPEVLLAWKSSEPIDEEQGDR